MRKKKIVEEVLNSCAMDWGPDWDLSTAKLDATSLDDLLYPPTVLTYTKKNSNEYI